MRTRVAGYGHGLTIWTESSEDLRDVVIQLGAANPDLAVTEWYHKGETPTLVYISIFPCEL